ncbi:MAG: hypothetical protein HKP30_17205 [Myxococcales bacterium]|nr:hypothetical protein [Myxococcales bacterium]
MSESLPSSPAFEVRCHDCDVSFPVGTKVCVHCGGRIGKPFLFRGPREEPGGELPSFEAMEEQAMAEAEEADPSRGRGLRIGVTALWLIAALFSALIRACQEG